MEYTQVMLGFVVSFIASILGAISGIGGGVIIKPVLDLVNFADISTISFLSSATVLAMATVTLLRSIKSEKHDNNRVKINFKISAFLALGSVVGGVGGKFLFNKLVRTSADPASVALVQSIILLGMICGVLFYLYHKKKIQTKHVSQLWACIVVGISLGATSSFLGIGGGPINIVLLYFLFSMNPKEAALNSIFIIFFSQISSLLYSAIERTVPSFHLPTLILMIFGGLLGAFIGGIASKKMTHQMVERLYSILMVVVALLCVVNIVGYF